MQNLFGSICAEDKDYQGAREGYKVEKNTDKYFGLALWYVSNPKARALRKESHTIQGNMDIQLEIIYEGYGQYMTSVLLYSPQGCTEKEKTM